MLQVKMSTTVTRSVRVRTEAFLVRLSDVEVAELTIMMREDKRIAKDWVMDRGETGQVWKAIGGYAEGVCNA